MRNKNNRVLVGGMTTALELKSDDQFDASGQVVARGLPYLSEHTTIITVN